MTTPSSLGRDHLQATSTSPVWGPVAALAFWTACMLGAHYLFVKADGGPFEGAPRDVAYVVLPVLAALMLVFLLPPCLVARFAKDQRRRRTAGLAAATVAACYGIIGLLWAWSTRDEGSFLALLLMVVGALALLAPLARSAREPRATPGDTEAP